MGGRFIFVYAQLGGRGAADAILKRTIVSAQKHVLGGSEWRTRATQARVCNLQRIQKGREGDMNMPQADGA